MDPEVAAAEMIVHQQQANDATERLCDAVGRGFPMPSIKRVTARVNAEGYELSEYEVARSLRAVLNPRRKRRLREVASPQLWLFRVA